MGPGKRAERDRIVDAAMEIAENSSWESVRLHDIAASLNISLAAVSRVFREKEEIVDAWFDRADEAMLESMQSPDFEGLSDPDRLHRLLTRWFGALAPYRRVTRQMILGKLEPGHVHYQLQGLFRVSRTVQWMREAAGRRTLLPWRAVEETLLTSFYLSSFVYWMYDASDNSRSTAQFMRCGLERLASVLSFSDQRASTVSEENPVGADGCAVEIDDGVQV